MFSRVSSVEHKRGYLGKSWYPNRFWPPLTSVVFYFHTTELSDQRLFGFQHSSKYILVCSTEETHTCLEQLDGEQVIFSFWVNYTFKMLRIYTSFSSLFKMSPVSTKKRAFYRMTFFGILVLDLGQIWPVGNFAGDVCSVKTIFNKTKGFIQFYFKLCTVSMRRYLSKMQSLNCFYYNNKTLKV